jgi:membrane-bound serine protease (ClpP class)
MVPILVVYSIALLMVLSELVVPSTVMGLVGLGGLAGSIAWAWRTEGWLPGMGLLVVAVVIVPAAISRALRRMSLGAQVEGTGSVPPAGIMPGMEGSAVTPLRPTGVVVLDGKRTDVLTNGEPIDRGVAIRVVSVEGNRIVVAPVERRVV